MESTKPLEGVVAGVEGKYIETAWIGTQVGGCDSCTIKERIGHSDVKITKVSDHGLNRGGLDVQSLISRM